MKRIIIMVCIAFMLLSALFICNWEIVIDIDSLPSSIGYNEELQIPKAYLKGKFFCKDGFEIDVTEESKNDLNNIGTYKNEYSAKFLFYSNNAEKEINVVDTEKPEIKLIYKEGYFTIPNEEYVEEGYEAYDVIDGDITSLVEKSIENGIVTYTVKDTAGNIASVQREIIYFDPVVPEITLIGSDSIVLYQNEQYNELGATAIDNCDGDISKNIRITGDVNTSKLGTYILEYSISDSYKNEAKIERTVKIIELPVVEEPKEPVTTDPSEGQDEQENTDDEIVDKEEKPAPEEPVASDKVIYLTFDDGPSKYTPKLLEILDKYNVKATFFVVDAGKYNYLMKEIVDKGHSIGIHSVTHDYQTIYASDEAFLNDMYSMQNIIYEQTGIKTNLIRFPGGSSNAVSKKYSEGIMTRLSSKIQELGFQYFDWNVSSGDAGGTTKTKEVVDNVINGVKDRKTSIVLQHDTKEYSVDAVEEIIKWGLKNGYTFLPLNINSPSSHHKISN